MRRLFAALLLMLTVGPGVSAQTDAPEIKRFKLLTERIVDQRLNGLPEDETLQQQALDLLEAFVARRASGPSRLDFKILNEALEAFVAQHPSVGESYQVIALQPDGQVYALVANFSFGGPAAIRLYTRPEGGAGKKQGSGTVQPRRVARLDRLAAPDFFDENINVVPLVASSGEIVFLTVSGRTDDLQTGAFVAWRWSEEGLKRVWESELLQQSSYETAGGEFRLTFCAEPDDDRPRVCRRMVREKWAWREGAWKRLEQADLPVAKP